MSSKKKKKEEFEAFLEKEILTQERYDRFYGDQIPGSHKEDQGRQQEKNSQQGETNQKETGMRYEDAQIDERILRAVRELGYEEMTPIQEQAIPVFMSGRDIIGQAQTGTGKTAAFGIPILQKINPDNRNLQAVILCPTRELAMQAAEELRKFSKYMHGIKVLPIYGGQDIVRQIKSLKGGAQIIVGTPGRVMDHMRRHTLKMEDVQMVVLDEADEMLNMGFREDIETILRQMPEERQTGLFSATMPKPILELTRTYQKNAVYVKMTPEEVTIPLIKQAYYQVKKQDKEEVLCRLIDYYDPGRALIFCNTKRMVDELTEHLKERGYEAEGLHGDLSQHQRDTVMNLFRSGRAGILIATDVAARGIDVNDVEAVYNYDVPEDIEYYVHRIGRTGRAGKTGRSFTLVVGREAYKIRDIERVCHTRIKERKIPSAADITSRKASKILKEAVKTIEQEDITRATAYILDTIALGEHSAVEIAAAFMHEKLGAEIEDIKSDIFSFDRKAGGRDRGRGTRGKSRDSRGRKREERDRNGLRDNNRSGREGYNRKAGYKEERERPRGGGRNSYYASLRVKTKK